MGVNEVNYETYNSFIDLNKVPNKDDHRWVSCEDTVPPIDERLGDNGNLQAKIIELYDSYNDIITYEWLIYNKNLNRVRFRRVDTSMEDFLFGCSTGETQYWRWAFPAPNNRGYNCG